MLIVFSSAFATGRNITKQKAIKAMALNAMENPLFHLLTEVIIVYLLSYRLKKAIIDLLNNFTFPKEPYNSARSKVSPF
jgi:hypothetical protein